MSSRGTQIQFLRLHKKEEYTWSKNIPSSILFRILTFIMTVVWREEPEFVHHNTNYHKMYGR